MSLRFTENSKQDKRPKRQSKVPSFETDLETQVERSIRYEHRNTAFIFIYEKACVTTTLNNRAWPRGYSDEAKLALRPGQYEFITHNSAPHRMINLGRASIERAREHRKLASEIYVKGQRPLYIWEGPGTENATIVTSQPTVSATQPANVFVPESQDMLFSPEPANKTTSRNTGEQLTVNSKNVAKTSSQMKATTKPLLFQESATKSTANASVQVLSISLKKHLVLLLFDWSFLFRVPLLCLASSKSF